MTIIMLMIYISSASSQSISQRLTTAIRQLESDPPLRHAITSLYVIDAKTGKKIYAHNEQIGLAPASTQKIFTSVAAFELLGNAYTFKTELAYAGKIQNGVLNGFLYIIGNGDPTLGSWRYTDTKEEKILQEFTDVIKKQGIKEIRGYISGLDPKSYWPSKIPDGWIWQDIGNYYGAPAESLNWRENQFDLVLQPGKYVGERAAVITTKPKLYEFEMSSEITTGAKGSGDNAYIYLPAYSGTAHAFGRIPLDEKEFTISGSMPNPALQLCNTLAEKLKTEGITYEKYPGGKIVDSSLFAQDPESLVRQKVFYTHYSPGLDSIVYWFMRKSINLYGEALIQQIAHQKTDTATTEKGVDILRDFFSAIGIEKSALNIIDGSGLSPQNRVTTAAQVKALQYAKTRPWFASFYLSMPEYNGMKVKSGSIGGARAFAGYHKAKDGQEYIFSIIVNNYDGSSGEVVKKMYRVLDILK